MTKPNISFYVRVKFGTKQYLPNCNASKAILNMLGVKYITEKKVSVLRDAFKVAEEKQQRG